MRLSNKVEGKPRINSYDLRWNKVSREKNYTNFNM